MLTKNIWQFFLDEGLLTINEKSIQVFYKHRQLQANSTEAGGLLFATIDFPNIEISVASQPFRKAFRSRTRFSIPVKQRKKMIDKMFNKGLHFIGEWHTHPENSPTPSSLDLKSMEQLYIQSKHQLENFLMIIVGNDPEHLNLWASLHNGSSFQQLTPCNSNQEIL